MYTLHLVLKITFLKIEDGRHFKNCEMRYLSNHLTDFDEIGMAMHITCSNVNGDQKFESLKIQDCGLRPS